MRISKITRTLLSVVVVATMIVTTGLTAFASGNVNYLVNTPPPIVKPGGIVVYGANPPGSGASIHNLAVSSYNYQVQKVGAQVYTDKWLKGATTFKVAVNNWTVNEFYGGTSNQLTVSVMNSSGSVVTSKTITFASGYNSANISLSGLSSTTNYYVKFSVPTNGNKYSFDGTISK